MSERRYDVLEEYVKDLQADKPSAVFSRLGDDKELAIVLRTAKTVHLLTRRPDTNADFAETLERRLLVQSEDGVQKERRILRWGYILPGIAVFGAGLVISWQLLVPGKQAAVAEANPLAPAAKSVVATTIPITNLAVEGQGADVDPWIQMASVEGQLELDYTNLEKTMSAVEELFQDYDLGQAQAAVMSIHY